MSATQVQPIELPLGKSVVNRSVMSSVIDEIFREGSIENRYDTYPNQGIILKTLGSQSAIGITSKCGKRILLVEKKTLFGITARNKEQQILQHVLDDPEIRCVVVTGLAGGGKSVCIASAALDQVFESRKGDSRSRYKKIIMSKPLEITTTSKYWGTTPGSEDDKFSPFLKSFTILFENLVGRGGNEFFKAHTDKGTLEFLPVELMRGVTLRDSIVWFDEAQSLNYKEMDTLGSRVDDRGNSKIILSGDLNQIDKRIRKDKTGMYKMLQSKHFLESGICAHVELTQNERGKVSQLFFDIFNK